MPGLKTSENFLGVPKFNVSDSSPLHGSLIYSVSSKFSLTFNPNEHFEFQEDGYPIQSP